MQTVIQMTASVTSADFQKWHVIGEWSHDNALEWHLNYDHSPIRSRLVLPGDLI